MAAVLLYVCSSFVVWAALWPISGADLICPASCTSLGGLIDCSKKGLLSVPADLRRCSWVTRLELQSNGLTALGPDDFKELRKLEVLFLSNNDITFINGSIFEELDSLRILKITHNKLTEMPVFPSHLGIKELSLAYNMIHTITQEALQALPHLEVLYLNHNQIMDIPIGAFPSPSHLTHLYLNNNKIMRLEPGCLDNLTALEQLKLNRNQMFELRKDIFATLASLRFLELSRNKISTIQGLTFKGLRSLQVLKLKRNSITTLMDGAFYGLQSISNLQLDHNSIANVTSSWLFGLSSLKHLSLTYNKIGTIQEDGWECCKQNLNTLDLTHNQLQTVYTKTFTKLARLENLMLDHNRLSRIDDGAFDGLRDLITLEMNDNAIAWTMEDMTGAFMGLQKLVKLGLKMNHIKSITNTAFAGLASLRQLHLEDNNITTIQHNSFQPLVNLRELWLNSTNLLCDCHLGWLAGWLKSYGFQNTIIAVCSYPQALRGKNIFQVPAEAFKCNDLEISKPVILSSPQSQNAYKGQNMTLTCTAAITVEGEPSIQWKKDKVVLADSLMENEAVSEGDVKRYTSRLNLHNVEDNMAGHYQCVVSNEFGSSFSQKARINVYVFPAFIKKPMDITVKAGQSAKLQCSASGQPQPVISWQKDGGDDFPAARERRMHVIPNDDQFFIASTRNVDEGVYTCRAQNEAGVITANASVIILETPDFISPMEEEKRARLGETAVLECMASGSPRPRLQWFKDSKPLVVTPRHFFTAHGQLLIIVETAWEDDGLYTCQMSNTLGIMRGNTRLAVLSADGQRKSSKGPRGLDDESTTTGIIIIAVVCCVVGTSLVWVIIIYQTRKRHEMYSATPTDETILPGEMPSGYSSSDKESSYTQPPINGITAYHYQDYQLKEMGYESSSLGRHPHRNNNNNNGWTSLRPPAAIFPSDVEEDDDNEFDPLASSPSQPDLRRQHQDYGATSIPNLHHQHQHSLHHHSGEESDSVVNCGNSPPYEVRGREEVTSLGGIMGGGLDTALSCGNSPYDGREDTTTTASSSSSVHNTVGVGGGRDTSREAGLGGGAGTLSTFHPGPTNHDRCGGVGGSRPIALPVLCGEKETEAKSSSSSSAHTATATTQTPCPNCQRRCDQRGRGWEGGGVGGGSAEMPGSEGCVRHDRLFPTDAGSYSDSNAYQRPPHPLVSARASSFSALPTSMSTSTSTAAMGLRSLRPVVKTSVGVGVGVGGGGGGSCCSCHAGVATAAPCRTPSNQNVPVPRLVQCHRHHSSECRLQQQQQQDLQVAYHLSNSNGNAASRDIHCCTQCDNADIPHHCRSPPPVYPSPRYSQSLSHSHHGTPPEGSTSSHSQHLPPHRQKASASVINV